MAPGWSGWGARPVDVGLGPAVLRLLDMPEVAEERLQVHHVLSDKHLGQTALPTEELAGWPWLLAELLAVVPASTLAPGGVDMRKTESTCMGPDSSSEEAPKRPARSTTTPSGWLAALCLHKRRLGVERG